MKLTTIPAMTPSDINRFWGKVDRKEPDECWPWVAKASHPMGYGLFKMRKSGNVVASRIACFFRQGQPSSDKPHALHSCDNPPCCNPQHLKWGNPKQNRNEAKDRGRAGPPPRNAHYRDRTRMPKGLAVHNQTLCEEKVRRAWALHLTGQFTIPQIAQLVGANKYPIADLLRGRSWRHLEGAPTVEALKAGGVRRGYNQFT